MVAARKPCNIRAQCRGGLGFAPGCSWDTSPRRRKGLLYFLIPRIALETGIGHTFKGTTLVAFTTSLPELIATLTAFHIGARDMALGNVFGSNAFNMVLFVPLDFLFSGSLFSVVKGIHAVTAFSVVTATGIAVIGQTYRKKERSLFAEPSSESVVVVIFLHLILLFFYISQGAPFPFQVTLFAHRTCQGLDALSPCRR
jgi:Ca2+/Na+ antiporter